MFVLEFSLVLQSIYKGERAVGMSGCGCLRSSTCVTGTTLLVCDAGNMTVARCCALDWYH